VNRFAIRADRVSNAGVSSVRRVFAEITIPQRLLIASAVVYGGVFALLIEYGRPGLGIGEGFFVAVILAAAATGPVLGGLAGLLALFLYELAIHERMGLVWSDFAHAPALTRFVAYVSAGIVTGFLARRLRLMLAQSLTMLEELADLAYGRVDWAALERARAQDASPDRV
jgi:K+-sensing histidine kinase KdpD